MRLFTFYSFFLLPLTEKEPLPQSVEVLLHAAARAATFLIVQSPGLHSTRLKSTTTSISFNLMWLRRQLLPSPAHWAFQFYAVTWTASAQRCPPYHRRLVSILCGHTDRNACTCPIASIWVLSFQSYAFFLSILCSCVGSFIARERTSHHNGFNLMQPCRLRCIGFNFAITSAISILCSRVGYVGNSAQRLHFLHNVALCILLSFGAVMVVCC